MNTLKIIGGFVAFPFVIALFYGAIQLDRIIASWQKFYYTKRGIRFIVQRGKFSDIVMRIDK